MSTARTHQRSTRHSASTRLAASLAALTLALCAGCGDDEANPAAALGEPDVSGWDSTAALTLSPGTPPSGFEDLDATYYDGVPCGPFAETVVDLFVPTGLTAPAPLVLFFHGGGFTGGSRTNAYGGSVGDDLRALVDAGVIYGTADYRLLQEPDAEGVIKPMHDGQVCLQYLRLHAEELGLDPTRVVVMGVSAGAGLSLWLGTASELAVRNHPEPVLRESTRVSGVVALETQATYDLGRWDTDVFVEYNFDLLGLAAAIGLDGRLLAFYGITELEDFDSPETLRYRAAVDMLGLMSHDDPPIFVRNENTPVSRPLTPDVAFHHPDHARAVHDRAVEVGVPVVAYAHGRDLVDPSGETVVDFSLRVLDVQAP
ncbi:MAG: alpha/beta hydrolase fold domain-containing protein [Polyangiales bacterium]|nr:alpha/beta hydrolase fold domain-containing protein [Myxococcales bacterium]MCB9656178.1 alpha/beta hydrolase fold domain-containing protein [Sandaracinaceae bacterium]